VTALRIVIIIIRLRKFSLKLLKLSFMFNMLTRQEGFVHIQKYSNERS